MRHRCAILTCLLLIGLSIPSISPAAPPERDPFLGVDGHYLMDLSRLDQGSRISGGISSTGKVRADSFYVYGGPGSQEGRFETVSGAPDTQGWISNDLTEVTPHWRSSTTNAATLGGGAPGNHAVICQNDEVFGLEPYTGYGNNWNDWLVLRLDLTALGYDPDQDSLDLRWSFDYVHETETGYDYFLAEWNQAGAYRILLAVDGSSYNDSTAIYEPVHFESEVLELSPADYVNGEIQLRLRVWSDGAWSDEDNAGGFDTEGRGAAGVDDIRVYLNDILVSFAGWEPTGTKADLPPGDITGHDNGIGLGTQGWLLTPSEFVGDFSKLFARFEDIDPCRDNRSWQYGFIDDGTPPKNDPQQRSTGGSVSATWSYGVPGGWVVNYSGGLTNGANNLQVRLSSPEIEWDLAGTADDNAWGCVIGADVWAHLPLSNCIFYTFEVRTWTSAEGWDNWVSPGWVYFFPSPVYITPFFDVTRLFRQNPEKVQLRIGVEQLPVFSFCQTTDATPAPLFDNFIVIKYVLDGPLMEISNGFVTSPDGQVRDHYPTDGTLDGSIRWDWFPVENDSFAVEILPVNLGTQLADPIHGGTMQVALLANPDFGDHASGARAPALQGLGAVVAGQDSRGWPIYTFSVQGQQVTWDGDVLADNFYFDLPDGPAHPDAPHQTDEDPLFFRGDIIHYYIEAMDDAGGMSHLPADITGFLDFGPLSLYSQTYVVRGLPNWDAGQQPRILFWDYDRARDLNNRQALRQAGLLEGQDFDYYSGTWLAEPVGLSFEQFNGYEMIFANDCQIDSAEVDLVLDWRMQDATRQVVWMGRNRAGQLQTEATGAGLNFLSNVLGVSYLALSVRSAVDGQYSPPVAAMTSCFATPFSADAKCPVLEDFNHVEPTASGAEISHEFLDASGTPYLNPVAAGIFWRQENMGFDQSTAFFPFRLSDIWDLREGSPAPDGASARSRLIREVLNCMGTPPGPAVDTGPPPLRFAMQQNIPNPFNPSTRIAYSIARREHVKLSIYDVSGRRVRTLLDESKLPGRYFIDWDSTDDTGSRVASGIYHYRLRAGSFEETKRMVLIK